MNILRGTVASRQWTRIPGVTVDIKDHPVVQPGPTIQVFHGTTDRNGDFELRNAPDWGSVANFRVTVRRGSRDLLTDHPMTLGQGFRNDAGDLEFNLEINVDWEPQSPLPQDVTDLARAARSLPLQGKRFRYRWGRFLGIPLCEGGGNPPEGDPSLSPGAILPSQYSWTEAAINHGNNRVTVELDHEGIERYESLKRFREQWPTEHAMPVPSTAATYGEGFITDKDFTWQRLAGPNPMLLKQIWEWLKDDFPVRKTVVLPWFPDEAAWDRALLDGRLFLLDYQDLRGIPLRGGDRYLPAPYALFYYAGPRDKPSKGNDLVSRGNRVLAEEMRNVARRADLPQFRIDHILQVVTQAIAQETVGDLYPVAIQIEARHHATKNPVFTPAAPDTDAGKRWGVAKLMVQVADLNIHEMKYHVVNTHLAMEAFRVAAERELHPTHPLFQLLQPHLRGILFINHLAMNTLVAPGGGFTPGDGVGDLLGNDLDGLLQVSRAAGAEWDLFECGFKRSLERRGLDTPGASFPMFPYRDDGLLVLSAIERFVRGYVRLYYVDDAAVRDDGELKQFLKVLDEQGVRSIRLEPTVGELIRLLVEVIFTCSAQHAAVNFPQYDVMGFVPNMPSAAWKRPIADDGSMVTDLFAFLPPPHQTRAAVELVANLALHHLDELGRYSEFPDPEAEELAKAFREDLYGPDGVEERIRDANRRRTYPYDALMPSRIPNSINT